jgi:ProP effector
VKNNRTEPLQEKPVITVRKTAGARSSSSHPAQPTPSPSSLETKNVATTTPVPPLTKPQQAVPLQAPAPGIVESGPSKKEQEHQARRELLEIFCDRWPQAFPRDYRQLKPLAIGIRQDIASHLPEQPLGRIGFVIGMYQQLMRPAYVRVVLQGGPRYDLEGKPRGEVTSTEKEHAGRDLHAFYERRKKKMASTSNSTPRGESSAEGPDRVGKGD